MTRIAEGTFTVEMQPQGEPRVRDGVALGRMALAKRYAGDLVADAAGEMLTAMTPVQGSAGYVAIERVSGTLHGKAGGFVLQHSGTMHAGEQRLSITIVPQSGTGALAGIGGELRITIAAGTHRYELEYALPASAGPPIREAP